MSSYLVTYSTGEFSEFIDFELEDLIDFLAWEATDEKYVLTIKEVNNNV